MNHLTNQRSKFQLPDDIHYLNNAYMSPLLERVARKGIEGLEQKYRPHEIGVDDFFQGAEDIRTKFSVLINNPEPDRIVLIPSVSYGMGIVARNVSVHNKKIVIPGEQFPSNVYPWIELAKRDKARIEMVDPPESLTNRGLEWNEKILKAIDGNTSLVALGQIHWADGTLFDLESVRERCDEVGALLIIDGTQSVGALSFDLSQIRPDALVCAGYKFLLGHYGLGVAYFGPAFDNGVPLEENWINREDSRDFAGLVKYKKNYEPGALRYEMGEHSNFVLVPMLQEALAQLNEWTPSRIQAYCASITEQPLKTLKKAGFWVEVPKQRSSHLFGIRHPEMDLNRLKTSLANKKIFVSIRGDAVRVSPHVYSYEMELELLVDILCQSVKRYA